MQSLSEIASQPLHVFLLTQDEELAASFQSLWPPHRISWRVFSDGQFVLEQVFSEPPDMVIAEQFLPGFNGIDVLRVLKAENVYRQICAVLMVRNEHISTLANASLDVDELVLLPASLNELRMRVELALHRTTATLDANPLTRLPGNTSIINTVERLIASGTDFALAYADLDNFKPYNDRYGFARGDEVLLMAARVINNTVNAQQSKPSFTGHIGGDDFVFILPPGAIENVCQCVVSDFDAIVPNFYDPEDRYRRYILSHDRQKREQIFPFLSISIAVMLNLNAKYTRYAQLSHAAGQLKQIVKDTKGSSYVIDRRG